MAEVEISYKGSNIATMNASGTKTLLTEGKYLEDDVEVTYTRPAAPSGTKNISITANGQTTEDVAAYASAQITANVPNTYSAADEGKVVSSGALVSQSSATSTTNDTYDTTLVNSVTVNVSGGAGDWTTTGVGSNTEPSGAVTFTGTKIGDYALYNKPITSITAASCTALGAFPLTGTSIAEIRPTHFPLLTGLEVNSCRVGSALKVFHVSAIKRANYNQLFQGNGNMQILRLPGLTTSYNLGGTNFCSSCGNLKLIDAGSANNIGNIQGAGALSILILRKTTICGLTASSNFNNTPFKSGGTGGTIYIPKALYDHLGDGGSSDYRAATNWSTIWGYGTITWAKLEGSPYEDPDFDDTGLWS